MISKKNLMIYTTLSCLLLTGCTSSSSSPPPPSSSVSISRNIPPLSVQKMEKEPPIIIGPSESQPKKEPLPQNFQPKKAAHSEPPIQKKQAAPVHRMEQKQDAFLPFKTVRRKKENQRMSIPVLMYHSIAPHPKSKFRMTPERFENDLQTMVRKGYMPITATDLRQAYEKGTSLPARPILITLDDGYQDSYTYALPLLKKYRAKATIFVITNTISRYPAYLKWPEIKKMEQSGLVDIESHTVTHANLKKVSASQLKREIVQSKKTLESQLHKPILIFCYPYGNYTDETINVLQQTGYRMAFTTKDGKANYSQQGPYQLHRFEMQPSRSLASLLSSF